MRRPTSVTPAVCADAARSPIRLVSRRVVQPKSGQSLIGHGEVDAIASGGCDPALDLGQEPPADPLTACLRRDPHRDNVKEALLLLIAVGRHESDGLGRPQCEQRRFLLSRGIAGGPLSPLLLGEGSLAGVGGDERRRIRGK